MCVSAGPVLAGSTVQIRKWFEEPEIQGGCFTWRFIKKETKEQQQQERTLMTIIIEPKCKIRFPIKLSAQDSSLDNNLDDFVAEKHVSD